MKENKIDIVIPFYNDSDEEWSKVLYDYLKNEHSNDRQVTGEERYRDWENFKYFFRGIEQNCKWVNKVFLIVASESQIPNWLNRNNSKLRIVYHDEYIPKELSNNYIYCNDDYFFINPIEK